MHMCAIDLISKKKLTSSFADKSIQLHFKHNFKTMFALSKQKKKSDKVCFRFYGEKVNGTGVIEETSYCTLGKVNHRFNLIICPNLYHAFILLDNCSTFNSECESI